MTNLFCIFPLSTTQLCVSCEMLYRRLSLRQRIRFRYLTSDQLHVTCISLPIHREQLLDFFIIGMTTMKLFSLYRYPILLFCFFFLENNGRKKRNGADPFSALDNAKNVEATTSLFQSCHIFSFLSLSLCLFFLWMSARLFSSFARSIFGLHFILALLQLLFILYIFFSLRVFWVASLIFVVFLEVWMGLFILLLLFSLFQHATTPVRFWQQQ